MEEELKELYDSLEEEDRKIEEHNKQNASELENIKSILDDYGVPTTRNGAELSPSDRVKLALEEGVVK